jgi:flagellar basal body-associated protein FliL
MAEEEQDQRRGEGESEDSMIKKLLPILVAVLVIAVTAAGGVAVGWFFGVPEPAQAAEGQRDIYGDSGPQSTGDNEEELRYYDFEPITVNVNEPMLNRYIRATITLAIKESDYGDAEDAITNKEPELKSWMTIFFSACELEDVRGEKNLNRLRREVLDSLNNQLWPKGKPLIDHVLFREFAVQ